MTPRPLSIFLSLWGILGAALLWALFTRMQSAGAPAGAEAGRLGLAAASLLPAATVLAAMILAQIASRFILERFDPTAGQESRFLVVNQRVISNTVEQLAGFTPALLALAAAVEPNHLPRVTALAFTFAVARLVFWGGYLMDPMFRAPGMAGTAFVNLATLGAAVGAWFL